MWFLVRKQNCQNVCKCCWKSLCQPFEDWMVLEAKNTAGKVLLIWGKWVVEKIDPGVGVWGGFQCHVY